MKEMHVGLPAIRIHATDRQIGRIFYGYKLDSLGRVYETERVLINDHRSKI